MQRVAIINSRQALRPTGASDWLRATIKAVETFAFEGNSAFLASLGEITYELTLFHLVKAGVEVEIILTTDQLKKYADSENELKRFLEFEFGLSPEKLRVVCIAGNQNVSENQAHVRDLEILKRANIVAPVSIRPRGFWDERLKNCGATRSKVDRRFGTSYKKAHTQVKQDYYNQAINLNAERLLEGHLIHWTRTSNHHWPGEKRRDFYQALSEARELYPRSAYATIEQILRQRLVRGSARHMFAGIAMVSATSASLTESVALMKYRTRYREMTFEPFAIAIPVDVAKKLGAAEAAYCSANNFARLSSEDKLYAHSSGASDANWAKEKEWRIRGDIDLKPIWNELIVLTENQEQADNIEESFGVKTLSVFED